MGIGWDSSELAIACGILVQTSHVTKQELIGSCISHKNWIVFDSVWPRLPSQLITCCRSNFPPFSLCAWDLNARESPAWIPFATYCHVRSFTPRSLMQPLLFCNLHIIMNAFHSLFNHLHFVLCHHPVRATLHPVLPGRNLIQHKSVSKLD